MRLKNLTTEATDHLLKEFNKRDIKAVLKRLENPTGTIDFRNTLDGPALFVNQDLGRAFRMPFQIQERVLIGETVFTLNLVYGLNQSTRYWVLILSEKPTRLYAGLNHNLMEIEEGFPIIHESPGSEAYSPGGFGIRKSAHRDERHRQFSPKVDNTVRTFLANAPRPLLVVGMECYHTFFNEVSAHKNTIVGRVARSHDKTSRMNLANWSNH